MFTISVWWNYDPNFHLSRKQQTTAECWGLLQTFFGGDGNPYWTGRHLYEVVFFPWWTEQVRKRQQSCFCGYHVWKPWENKPWIFLAGFGVGRHATVLRTQHCLSGLLLWGCCCCMLLKLYTVFTILKKESQTSERKCLASAQGHSQVKILWNMENKSADEPTFAHQL